MTFNFPGTLQTAANIQYLHMLVSGEVLCKFDILFTKIESGTPLKLEDIILGLGAYFSPVNVLSFT